MNRLILGIVIAATLLILTEKGGEQDGKLDADKTDVPDSSGSDSLSGEHSADSEHSWNRINTADLL